MKVSIGRTALVVFDDRELEAFEDELKHLIRDKCKRAPELMKVRSITLRHSLCHMDCIKKQKSFGLRRVHGSERTSVRSRTRISQPSLILCHHRGEFFLHKNVSGRSLGSTESASDSLEKKKSRGSG